MNTRAEYAELVKNSLLARRIFEVQSTLEETSAGLDWKKLFKILVKEISEQTGSDSPEMERRAEEFMLEFNAIEMADTVYPDVALAFKRLIGEVGEVALWSTGDVINQNQKIKIEKARVLDLLQQTPGQAKIESIIATDKFIPLPDLLDRFWQDNGQPKTLLVAAYDDSVKQLAKLKPVLEQWSLPRSVFVEPLYIGARCGRQVHDPLPKDFDLQHEEVYTLTEAVNLLSRKAAALKLNPNQVLILLDFDGALSDNCLMRLRQGEVVFKYIVKAVSNLDRQYYGIPARIL